MQRSSGWWRWLLIPWALPCGIVAWVLVILPLWALRLIALGDTGPGPVCVFHIRYPFYRRWNVWALLPECGRRLAYDTWLWLWGDTIVGFSAPFAAVLARPGNHRDERHELRHVDQWLVFGLTLPIAYLLNLAIFGYERNPFEVDARRAERNG